MPFWDKMLHKINKLKKSVNRVTLLDIPEEIVRYIADLKKCIAEILKHADLAFTSAKKVRMQLEEDTKTDLTSRKENIGYTKLIKLILEVIDDMKDEEEEEDKKSRNGDIKKNGVLKNKDPEEAEKKALTKKPSRLAAAVSKGKYKEDSEGDTDESDFSEKEPPKPKTPAPNTGRGMYFEFSYS